MVKMAGSGKCTNITWINRIDKLAADMPHLSQDSLTKEFFKSLSTLIDCWAKKVIAN